MLVGSNDRAIDIVNGPVDLALGIGVLLHGLKETLPDTRFAPAIETAGHSAPRTIAFRQIAPRGTGAQHPQDAVEDASMIQSGWTLLSFLRWKQRLEPLPLRVGEFFAFHTGECTPPARVCKHALVSSFGGEITSSPEPEAYPCDLCNHNTNCRKRLSDSNHGRVDREVSPSRSLTDPGVPDSGIR